MLPWDGNNNTERHIQAASAKGIVFGCSHIVGGYGISPNPLSPVYVLINVCSVDYEAVRSFGVPSLSVPSYYALQIMKGTVVGKGVFRYIGLSGLRITVLSNSSRLTVMAHFL